MSVFGVPQIHEDDALRAVRAAIDMRSALDRLNVEIEREWGTQIQARIGVNTGEVLAADPASGESFVSGDAVNVAARLEQAAEPGEILLGEPTYRLVRAAVIAEPLEPLVVKGKAEPLPAYDWWSWRPAPRYSLGVSTHPWWGGRTSSRRSGPHSRTR
jgi:class 3 adenylate cyclase